MRSIIVPIFSLLTLIGCSHVQYVGSDKQEKTVSLEGGQYDLALDDIQDAAEEHCHKPYFYSMETKGTINYAQDPLATTPQYIYTYKCQSLSESEN